MHGATPFLSHVATPSADEGRDESGLGRRCGGVCVGEVWRWGVCGSFGPLPQSRLDGDAVDRRVILVMRLEWSGQNSDVVLTETIPLHVESSLLHGTPST